MKKFLVMVVIKEINAETNRNEWLSLLKNNPDKGKKELHKINTALFTWLYKNDREWFNNNSPDKKGVNKLYNRVDWNIRDKDILPR